MPTYKWEIVFDAADVADANQQATEALDAFGSYHREDLIELDEGEES